jgi:hypothetical protein
VKLRARWTGGFLPRVNDYLMSTTRPRFAYRISRVTRANPRVHWDPVLKTEVHRLAIEVDRVPIPAVPKTARVHPWRWDKREARKPKGL